MKGKEGKRLRHSQRHFVKTRWHRRQRERCFNRIIGKESRREVGYVGKREIKGVFENGL